MLYGDRSFKPFEAAFPSGERASKPTPRFGQHGIVRFPEKSHQIIDKADIFNHAAVCERNWRGQPEARIKGAAGNHWRSLDIVAPYGTEYAHN